MIPPKHKYITQHRHNMHNDLIGLFEMNQIAQEM